MNKKKILVVAMSLAMVAILAIGGTIAYFTDTEAKTNTFTVGNVDIVINEYMEDENDEWVEYADQKLFPQAYADTTFNKLVETENTGSEAAYIRTFVTCPKDMYDVLGIGFNAGPNSVISTNENGKNMYPVTWKDVGTFTINGEETAVFLCEVYGEDDDAKKVAPGESVLSVTKVWLYNTVTNEQVKAFELENGKFVVDVVSQAIQADEDMTYAEAMAALGTIDQALMTKLFDAE